MTNKHLYTTTEFFHIIDKYLDENNLKPEWLIDYGLATSHPVELRTYEWDLIGTVNFGCEGIYLDLYAKGNIAGGDYSEVSIGTYKTLDASKEAFKRMGDLNAEFVFATRDFVNEHMDDFEWTGWHVEYFRDGVKVGGVTCSTYENARKRLKYGETYYHCDTIVITDNATQKEETVHIAGDSQEKDKIA